MKTAHLTTKAFLYILHAALVLGALFASIENGNWLLGLLPFSFLFLFSFVLLKIAHNWSNGGKTLGYILALAFFLRLAVGVTLHLALPVYGHNDDDGLVLSVFRGVGRAVSMEGSQPGLWRKSCLGFYVDLRALP